MGERERVCKFHICTIGVKNQSNVQYFEEHFHVAVTLQGVTTQTASRYVYMGLAADTSTSLGRSIGGATVEREVPIKRNGGMVGEILRGILPWFYFEYPNHNLL